MIELPKFMCQQQPCWSLTKVGDWLNKKEEEEEKNRRKISYNY